jgi:hypothetical protein
VRVFVEAPFRGSRPDERLSGRTPGYHLIAPPGRTTQRPAGEWPEAQPD